MCEPWFAQQQAEQTGPRLWRTQTIAGVWRRQSTLWTDAMNDQICPPQRRIDNEYSHLPENSTARWQAN